MHTYKGEVARIAPGSLILDSRPGCVVVSGSRPARTAYIAMTDFHSSSTTCACILFKVESHAVPPGTCDGRRVNRRILDLVSGLPAAQTLGWHD